MKKMLATAIMAGFTASLVCAQEPAKPAEKKAESAKPAAAVAAQPVQAKPAPAASASAQAPAQKHVMVQKGRGGFMGFLAGCLFGVRSAAAYNDGKTIHWREWITLVPFVSIWNGIEGANGMTTQNYADKYGAAFY